MKDILKVATLALIASLVIFSLRKPIRWSTFPRGCGGLYCSELPLKITRKRFIALARIIIPVNIDRFHQRWISQDMYDWKTIYIGGIKFTNSIGETSTCLFSFSFLWLYKSNKIREGLFKNHNERAFWLRPASLARSVSSYRAKCLAYLCCI